MNILFTRRHKYQRNFCANVCLYFIQNMLMH